MSGNRKPLIIRGARQVGKSTLVREFAKEFDLFLELNLEKEEDRKLFILPSVKDTMEALLLREGKTPKQNSILLFIDEIQESPEAIHMLRYFYEEYPEIYVICAGSLLEFALEHTKAFPVGRVSQIVLHPFDFEEYLEATGNQKAIQALHTIPLPDYAFDFLQKEFHTYLTIGGMPEIIRNYIQTGSLSGMDEYYHDIWQSYQDDIEKYGRNTNQKNVLRHILQTAAFEKDRITMAGFGNSNYRSRETGEALRALDKSRIIRLVYPVTSTLMPLQVDFKRKPRLQFLDTGLLNHILGIQSSLVGLADFSTAYRGRIIQHAVYQQLESRNAMVGQKLHFWVREKTNTSSEVDMVYPHHGFLIPVEVKSGSKGKLRSLHIFMEKTNHRLAIRLFANRYSRDSVKLPSGKAYQLYNIPYFQACVIPEYLNRIWEEDPTAWSLIP